MKTHHLISVIAVIGSGLLAGEEPAKKDTASTDALDISALQKRVEEAGVPTPQSVQQMQEKAAGLVRDSKWQDAASAYEVYARSANWLANLIGAGLQPFYNAPYDDRKSYSITKGDIQLENLANTYRAKRDEATVSQAECYMRMNDTRRAVPLLVKALELISIKDAQLWLRARKDLYSLIQVQEAP